MASKILYDSVLWNPRLNYLKKFWKNRVIKPTTELHLPNLHHCYFLYRVIRICKHINLCFIHWKPRLAYLKNSWNSAFTAPSIVQFLPKVDWQQFMLGYYQVQNLMKFCKLVQSSSYVCHDISVARTETHRQCRQILSSRNQIAFKISQIV